MVAWTGIACDLIQKAFYSAGIVPFDKNNLAMKSLITDPQVAQNIHVGRRQNVSLLNRKEATSEQVTNALDPYYALRIFHGLVQHKVILDFAHIYAADIANEWKTGDSNYGKVFSPVPAVFENGINMMRHYQ